MKFEVQLTGPAGHSRKRVVELERQSSGWKIRLDGEPLDADVVQLSPHIFSVLLCGRSHELCLTPLPGGSLKVQDCDTEFIAEVLDPRAWRGRRHGEIQAEGRQNVLAPMPGKVVRVLVRVGDAVEAGQGLLVVEAMKMQNELRSPKRGVVQRLLVAEGQPVNAGDTLLSVE